MLQSAGVEPHSSRQLTDHGMAKLLQFRRPDHASESCGSECRSSSAHATSDVPAQISPMGIFRAKAREDIRTVILMFDVALMHGHLAIANMDDSETRERLEAHLRVIEEMLDLARIKAVDL
jgi:hypothetical protein